MAPQQNANSVTIAGVIRSVGSIDGDGVPVIATRPAAWRGRSRDAVAAEEPERFAATEPLDVRFDRRQPRPLDRCR